MSAFYSGSQRLAFSLFAVDHPIELASSSRRFQAANRAMPKGHCQGGFVLREVLGVEEACYNSRQRNVSDTSANFTTATPIWFTSVQYFYSGLAIAQVLSCGLSFAVPGSGGKQLWDRQEQGRPHQNRSSFCCFGFILSLEPPQEPSKSSGAVEGEQAISGTLKPFLAVLGLQDNESRPC